jgi:hypothetical protein
VFNNFLKSPPPQSQKITKKINIVMTFIAAIFLLTYRQIMAKGSCKTNTTKNKHHSGPGGNIFVGH